MIADLWQDLRHGARTLLKQPGFTLIAVLTLALGIGSTTTIFSAIYNILLDPFPYTDAHRIVNIQIRDTSSSRPGGRSFFQAPEFLDYQEQNHVFEEVKGSTLIRDIRFLQHNPIYRLRREIWYFCKEESVRLRGVACNNT